MTTTDNIRVLLTGRMDQENQRDIAIIIAAAPDIKLYVATDCEHYHSLPGIPQQRIYHLQPTWPTNISRFRPYDLARYQSMLEDVEPDIILSLGVSELAYLSSTINFSPAVLLPQGGEVQKATGDVYWSDSYIKAFLNLVTYRPLMWDLLRHVDEVWTSGTEQNRELFRDLGLPEGNFYPFDWDVVDTDTFSRQDDAVEFGSDPDQTIIGSFRRIRGDLLAPSYETFLDAVGRIAEDRADFHVVIGGFYEGGDSSVTESVIDEKLAEHDLQEYVTKVDLVPKDELPQYYSGLDIYVNFSHEGLRLSGIGSSAKEGMACECALLTYDDPKVDYVIEDGDNGLIVSHRDVDAVEKNLRKLLDDTEYRNELGQSARRTVVETYSPEHVQRQITERCEILIDN